MKFCTGDIKEAEISRRVVFPLWCATPIVHPGWRFSLFSVYFIIIRASRQSKWNNVCLREGPSPFISRVSPQFNLLFSLFQNLSSQMLLMKDKHWRNRREYDSRIRNKNIGSEKRKTFSHKKVETGWKEGKGYKSIKQSLDFQEKFTRCWGGSRKVD